MRLGLSHKELDALIDALVEIVEVYQDDVEMRREAEGSYLIWLRLLRRAESLRAARIEGALCQGCGDPVMSQAQVDGTAVLVTRQWVAERRAALGGQAGVLAMGELLDEGRGPDDGVDDPRMDPSRGPGAREGDGEPMGAKDTESQPDRASRLEQTFQRLFRGSRD